MKKRLFLLAPLVALLGVSAVGLYPLTAPAPVAHAAAPTKDHVFRVAGSDAFAEFERTQGDVTDFVIVDVSPTGFEVPKGSGPDVFVEVFECNSVACFDFSGTQSVPGLQFDRVKLTSAVLPPTTVPVSPFDPSGPPGFDVSVAVTWTGVGDIVTEHFTDHFSIGHQTKEMTRFRGEARDAMVSATISYPSPQLGPITLTQADLLNTFLEKVARMSVVISH